MGETLFGERLIKGSERRGKPLRFCLREYLGGAIRVRLAKGKSAAHDLTSLRLRQPAEKIQEKWDRITFGEYLVDRELNPKHLTDYPQSFLPVATVTLETLRVRRCTSEFFDITKPDYSVECPSLFRLAPKSAPKRN